MASTASKTTTTTTTAVAAVDNHSPRHSVSSPQTWCADKAASAWTQIVSGESEKIAAAPLETAVVSASSSASSIAEEESSENGNSSGSNAVKRTAWNKPSNGALEIGAVMGAELWPTLSELARGGATKSSADSLKGLSDGSSTLSVSQGTETVTVSSLRRQTSNNARSNAIPNHVAPARQRSMKHNVANSSSSNGDTPLPPGVQGQVGEVHLNNSSPRDHSLRKSQARGANDHQQQMRNPFRNRNGGPHSRDGSHHHNLGGRREQDPGNPEWNNHRHFNGRDGHMQAQRPFTRLIRHPPQPSPPPSTSGPFMSSSPVRGFGSPMGFPDFPPPVYYVDSLRGMQLVVAPVPPHPMFFPDFQLHHNIVKQIDYYFSNENLIKDTFLRQNMDDEGWVHVNLIAGFKKVSQLTPNIQMILDAMRNSNLVEVQGDKIRRRNDWKRWIMPRPVQLPNVSSHQPSADMLGAQIQIISLEENATNHNVKNGTGFPSGATCSSSSSGDSNRQSELSSNEGLGRASSQGGLNHSASARIPTK